VLNRSIIVSSGATALVRLVTIGLVVWLIGCGGSSSNVVPPPNVASVTVTPPSQTIAPGEQQQFSATAKDSGGNVVTGVSFTWSSDAASVANVDTNGLATAVGQGTAHITATTTSEVAGFGILTVALSSSSPCVPTGAGTIPCTFWGIHVDRLTSYPLELPYGEFRGWDSGTANWPDIQSCPAGNCSVTSPPPFVWNNLDTELSDVYQASVNDVMYTLSRTPNWASQNPTDSTCNYAKQGPQDYGECWPPVDLNADGTGTNQTWRNWIAAIATHVNDPSYLQTHSHIKFWESWNEFSRLTSWEGTYNQLVRLAQDARCIITGKVVAITATGESCAVVLGTVDLTKAADPGAVMVAPSSTGIDPVAISNFLYCNDGPQTQCTTGSAGADAVDIINVHMYIDTQTPEQIVTGLPNLTALLQPAELQKPIWNGEGSWGLLTETNVVNIWAKDAYARAGMIARYFALLWSANIKQTMWYGYDFPTGQLFNSATGQLDQPEATAWISTYNWLSNATPSGNSPFCQVNGTVYHCDFTESNGLTARLVWDSKYGQDCSSMGAGVQPIICGNTPYSVDTSTFNKDWVDLSGSVHSVSSTVTIGANPILLEGQ
jgi:Big-like domain-containing protein